MEDQHPNSVFNYLGQEISQQQVAELAHSVQQCFEPGTRQFNTIGAYSKQLTRKKERWPDKIRTTWQNRNVPVYCPETITKLNTARAAQIDFANEQRKRLRDAFSQDILRVKRKIDDLHKRRENSEEKYNENALSSAAQLQLLAPWQNQDRVRIQAALRSSYDSYAWTVQRLSTNENGLWRELQSLEGDMAPIRTISTQSSTQKNLIVTKGHAVTGWLPGEDKYVLIQQNKMPPTDEIFRRISFEPESSLSNLPLSIYTLISFADEIGATDSVLLSMIVLYLKKYKSSILESIDIKKRSMAAIMEILSYQCDTEIEQQAVLLKIKHFKRDPIESFASAVNRFESLYTFWLQLDSPHTADSISLLSYEVVRQITQHLLSPRCAQQFSKWSSDTIKSGGKITKDIIIQTVARLESYADLKLHSPRTLPGTVITTTLGLPIGSTEIDVNAHLASHLQPRDLRSSNSSNNRTRNSNNGSRPLSNGPRPPSTGPWLGSRSPRTPTPGPSRSKPTQHQQRRSPHRTGNHKEQRGRSNPRSSSKNVHSANCIDPDLESLQFSSHYSTSQPPARKQSIPTMFRRALTPRTANTLRNSYFYSSSGENRFKDVRSRGYCLRCYGSNHKASSCRIYTQPTPVPCRLCFHLFHPTEDCCHYDQNGKTRPPSRVRSSSGPPSRPTSQPRDK